MLNFFEEDTKSLYKEFWKNNLPANKGPEKDYLKDGIDTQGLEKTIVASEWPKKDSLSGKSLIEQYDIDGEEYD